MVRTCYGYESTGTCLGWLHPSALYVFQYCKREILVRYTVYNKLITGKVLLGLNRVYVFIVICKINLELAALSELLYYLIYNCL
jgi:hypothetical protein